MNISDIFNAYPPSLKNRLCHAARQCAMSAMLDSIIDKGLLSDYLDGKDNAKAAEQAFYEEAMQDGGEIIWKKCPPLLELIEKIKKNYFAAEEEFRARFSKEDLGELIGVAPDMGDSHNFGRTTYIITTSKGKYVYKPHDMRIDAVIGDFFEKFFPDTVRLPKVIVRDGYGFAEFIENRPAATMDEARAYYRRMGGFAVALNILGGTDMHFENLLAMGGYPVPIDLETIINPSFVDVDSIYTDIRLNNLLPNCLGETDISLMFSNDEQNVSAPMVNGKKVLVPECPDDFLCGFEQAYKNCLKRKDELAEYIRAMPAVTVRLVMRSTQAYYNLYVKTCSRAWLNDPNLRQCIHDALNKGEKPIPEPILQSETDALLRGDIPYFCTETDSVRVLGTEGSIVKSCVQNALDNIALLSEKDMRYHMATFTRACVNKPPRGGSKDFVSRAEALFDKLVSEIIETPKGATRWLEITPKRTGMTNNGFMSGTAGIALFAAAIAKMTGRQDAAELRDNLLKQILSDLPAMKQYNWSDGLAGIAHAALLMPESPYAREIVEKITELLPNVEPDKLDNDVMLGLAGILLSVCEINNPRLEPFKHKIAQALIGKRDKLWKTLNNKRFLSGFGHGQCGIGYALERAGYAADAQPAYDFETNCYSEKLNGWPDFREHVEAVETMYGYCAGAPGVGLAALRRGDEVNLERAIKGCLEQPLLNDNHLCCGNSAAIDFLLECGLKLNRPELIRAARERMNAIENIDIPHICSLFDGIAGVGYTLLRCADPAAIVSPIII